jgi:hypothetical protein
MNQESDRLPEIRELACVAFTLELMGVNLQNYLNFQFFLIFRIFRLDRPYQSSEILRDNYLNKFFFLFLKVKPFIAEQASRFGEKFAFKAAPVRALTNPAQGPPLFKPFKHPTVITF